VLYLVPPSIFVSATQLLNLSIDHSLSITSRQSLHIRFALSKAITIQPDKINAPLHLVAHIPSASANHLLIEDHYLLARIELMFETPLTPITHSEILELTKTIPHRLW
jgi:hypothetical protein